MVKVAIYTTVFNRPDYVKQSVESLKETIIPEGVEIKQFIRDDHSDLNVSEMYSSITWPKQITRNNVVYWVERNTIKAQNDALQWNPDYIVNFESDLICKPYWLKNILDIFNKKNAKVVSGYNSVSHPVKEVFEDVYIKETIGGAGLATTPDILTNLNLIDLWEPMWGITIQGWDWHINNYCISQNIPMYCTNPSVIQHIGVMGAHSRILETALDYE